MQPAFMGRKHTTTQNVLVADWVLRYTYVLTGWEGSSHDALILADALERPNGIFVHPSTHYSPPSAQLKSVSF
jgi:hypothetical protein